MVTLVFFCIEILLKMILLNTKEKTPFINNEIKTKKANGSTNKLVEVISLIAVLDKSMGDHHSLNIQLLLV